MSFALTAQQIRVDDGHLLRADLQNAEGEWNPAEFDLNTVIGNNEGNLVFLPQSRSEHMVTCFSSR